MDRNAFINRLLASAKERGVAGEVCLDGGESFEVAPHSGEEFGYVVDGTVSLICDGKRNVLHGGETFCLHGNTFHTIKDQHKTPAHVLWVSTPPLF